MSSLKTIATAAAVAVSVAGAAEAATYPTFVFDQSASSINVTLSDQTPLCFCSLSAEFSAGVDGASWTPTSATDSWSIDNFIDWTGSGFIGIAEFAVELVIAFSDPDPASSTTTGTAGFATFLGVLSAGTLSWDPSPSLEFAQGSILDIDLEGGTAIGFGTQVSTGVTFTGNEIAPVPLPASALLLLGGLGGLTVLRRRKKAA